MSESPVSAVTDESIHSTARTVLVPIPLPRSAWTAVERSRGVQRSVDVFGKTNENANGENIETNYVIIKNARRVNFGSGTNTPMSSRRAADRQILTPRAQQKEKMISIPLNRQ